MDEIVKKIKNSNIKSVLSNYMAIHEGGCDCPFCKKDTFFISDKANKFKCFSCGEEGGPVDFVAKYKKITQEESLKEVGKHVGIAYESQLTQEQKDIFHANMLAAKYYYENLKNNKNAQKLFEDRGLTKASMVKFGLGYDGNKRGSLEKYLTKKGVSKDIIIKSNLLSKSKTTGHIFDRFSERLMFPIFDENGRVTGFGGRKTKESQDAKYINTADTPVFHKRENLFGLNMMKKDRVPYMILCEGYMDVISLHQVGFYNAVAPLGTAFPQELSNKISKFTNKVYLTFDSDEAGTKAKLRAISKLKQNGLEIFIPNLSPYKDPDEMIKNAGQGAFINALKNADSSYEFEINNWIKEHPEKYANIIESVIVKSTPEEVSRYLNAYKDITGEDFDYRKLSGSENSIETSLKETQKEFDIIL